MSGRLTGAVVLVTGATGHVGWGVAHASADEGARLLLPTRSASGAEQLAREFPGAAVVTADLATPDGAATVAQAVAEAGQLDHVVAPMGSWWQKGASLDQDPQELGALLDTYATAQLRLVQATASALAVTQGSYLLVTGAAGEHLLPGTGLLVVAVRAQYALADVLRQELAAGPVRFNELRIGTRVERDPRPGVVPARVAGQAFVAAMASDVSSELIRFPARPA